MKITSSDISVKRKLTQNTNCVSEKCDTFIAESPEQSCEIHVEQEKSFNIVENHTTEDAQQPIENINEPNIQTEHNEKRYTVKKVVLNILAFIVGAFGWYISSNIMPYVMGFILQIPILGDLLYWPVDSDWAAVVIINVFSVYAGASPAKTICDFADSYLGLKCFGVVITLLSIGTIVVPIIYNAFTWSLVAPAVLSMVAAITLCFSE